MRKLVNDRIKSFLKNQNFTLDENESNKLVDYVLTQILQQNRKKISPRFIIENIALFLNKEVESIRKGLRPNRPRREHVDYSCTTSFVSPSRRGSLLQILARPISQVSKYAVTEAKHLGSPLARRVRPQTSNEYLVRSPGQVTVEKDSSGMIKARGLNNTPYKPILGGSSGILWGEDNSSRQITFNMEHAPSKEELFLNYPELFNKPSEFEFEVTRELVEHRLKTKRSCSQKQITGYSAKEFFHELGAVIQEKAHGSFYHLAHRQGHGLGGEPLGDNLDAATEGSNYQLLFFIENPFAELLLDNASDVNRVSVKGKVTYHPDLPIPEEISYTVSWGNGRVIQKTIYPLDYEKPTMDDNHVAKAFIRAQRSPVKTSTFTTGFFATKIKESLSHTSSSLLI
jgi:hypothetical protein